VINHGRMTGDVFLEGGDDTVDMSGGKLDGKVLGGFGDDVYTVDNANIDLEEQARQGNDRIVSSVSFTLPANFETLRLSGKDKIDATGSNRGDNLIGNNSANNILGKAGDDDLTGGKGNDVLTGGQDADTFIFANRTGRDTVTDFTAAGNDHDVIDLSDVTGLKDFNDVKQNMEQSGGDTIITISSRDVIKLEDVQINSLHANDFNF
jgi:Ca2+-binding RTX toxin-like protein